MSMTAIAEAGTPEAREKQASESRKALVRELTTRTKEARTFWEPQFERIRDNIRFAGGDQWQDAEEKMADAASDKFKVNFVQRELNQQVSAIYAKNPTVVCERRKRLEYRVWDGDERTLALAQQVLMQAAPLVQTDAQARMIVQTFDAQNQAAGGQMAETPQVTEARAIAGNLPPAVIQAQQVVADYQEGQKRKVLFDRIGDTATLVFNHQLDEQQPDFESQMKDLILREKTTGAGFVTIKYQRENETIVTSSATHADVVDKITRLRQLAGEAEEDELSEAQKEQLLIELNDFNSRLQDQQKPRVEGLVLDFKPTTSIIIDPKCRSLFKFLGAGWVAEELMMTPDQIEEIWGVDVESKAVPYQHGVENRNQTNLNTKAGGANDRDNVVSGGWPAAATCCVWIIQDKQAQMKYVVCDGFDDFLEEPSAPWPAVKGFWHTVALKLNRLEIEENHPKAGLTIYGESNVQLMKPMQEEVNRSQEALREHRLANRPGHICGNDTFDKADMEALANRAAHDVIPLNNIPPGGDVSKVLVAIPTNPIDPKLYDTSGLMQQVLLVTGTQQANMGTQGAGEKATGQAIAEQSRIVGASSEVDSLDKFLCEIARIGGEMLFKEMTMDTVTNIAGPGAVWPNDPKTREEINCMVFLKVEAGSMGRPNKAMELSNLQMIMPQLIQLAQAMGLPLAPLVKYVAKVLELDFDIEEWLAQAAQVPPGAQQQISAARPTNGGPMRTEPGLPPNAPAADAAPVDPNNQQPPVPGASIVQAQLTKAQNGTTG